MKGYDGYFLLEHLIDNSMRPDNIIFTGSKIMSMHVSRGLNMRILDSLNFLPMKLSKVPEAFGLQELKKGYFPHYFNKTENQNYIGKLPDMSYYGFDSMSAKERVTFLKWYLSQKEEVFNFADEILAYCRSDVDILRKACMTFQKLLLDITENHEKEGEEGGGVDPLNYTTIASVCSVVFRTKFLKEDWNIKLERNGETTDWLPATKSSGKYCVYLNDAWKTEADLHKEDYQIEESRFLCSPLAQVPSSGYVSRDQFSMSSIQWLEWVMEKNRTVGKPLHIRHALNGGEVTVPGTKYRLDGYCKETNTAYEFHGCLWHGCRHCYPDRRQQTKVPRTKQSLEELHTLTLKKERYLKSQGMKYACIWEHEFNRLLQNNEKARVFVQNLDLQQRLDPRDSFFGGRTNAVKLKHHVQEGEKIRYVDFTSLYPYVNKYCKYPLKEPMIITSDFTDISEYFGIAKVKVLPPRRLYHPVLPQKVNGKLTFALCRTCAENQNQRPCQCDDESRSMVGTWCTPELTKAKQLGYVILKIYEVYHWEHVSDPSVGDEGIFGSYINMFLKIKQEASGWPSWVKTEADADKYIRDYAEKEGIRLNRSNISHNNALRSLAKLLLNSFWGKFGQRLNMPQMRFFHDLELDHFFRCISDSTKNIKDFSIVAPDTIQVSWESKEDMVQESMHTNIFIATFTTCWARLKLYDLLEILNERVLYFDTDSVIYLSSPGQEEVQTGDYLGQLTDELQDGDYIIDFVSGGPKQYAYKTYKGAEVCKIRGFSLNFVNSQLLNFEAMSKLVKLPREDEGKSKKRKREDDQSSVTLVNPSKITRLKEKRKIYNRIEKKEYNVVFTKRVINPDTLDTFPYGF